MGMSCLKTRADLLVRSVVFSCSRAVGLAEMPSFYDPRLTNLYTKLRAGNQDGWTPEPRSRWRVVAYT